MRSLRVSTAGLGFSAPEKQLWACSMAGAAPSVAGILSGSAVGSWDVLFGGTGASWEDAGTSDG